MFTPEEFWSTIEDLHDHVRQSSKNFPLYAPAHWSGMIMVGEWMLDGGSRGLIHGSPEGDEPFLHVRTTENNARESARLLWMNQRGPFHDRVDYLDRIEDFEAETPILQTVPVGDSVLDFDFWEDGSLWWAAASGPGHGLSLEGRNMNPVELALVAVTDIEPYITGRIEWLRKQRGER